MVGDASTESRRLKLKEGDMVQTRVTGITNGSIAVDTSSWVGIETATFVGPTDAASLLADSDVYAVVREINADSIQLVPKRNVYARNHLPGDLLRVRVHENVSERLYRAEPEQLRNLEALLVLDAAIGADLTVEIQKIRDGTALAVPASMEAHHEGLVQGAKVVVNTTATKTTAAFERFCDRDGTDNADSLDLWVELTRPAPVSGTVTARVIETTPEVIRASLDREPSQILEVDQTIEQHVEKGNLEFERDVLGGDAFTTIRLESPSPCTGTAEVKVLDYVDGKYTASITGYLDPEITVGGTYPAQIISSKDEAKMKAGRYSITTSLTHSVSKSGEGVVRVVDIDSRIRTELKSGISGTKKADSKSKEVDIQKLSRL